MKYSPQVPEARRGAAVAFLLLSVMAVMMATPAKSHGQSASGPTDNSSMYHYVEGYAQSGGPGVKACETTHTGPFSESCTSPSGVGYGFVQTSGPYGSLSLLTGSGGASTGFVGELSNVSKLWYSGQINFDLRPSAYSGHLTGLSANVGFSLDGALSAYAAGRGFAFSQVSATAWIENAAGGPRKYAFLPFCFGRFCFDRWSTSTSSTAESGPTSTSRTVSESRRQTLDVVDGQLNTFNVFFEIDAFSDIGGGGSKDSPEFWAGIASGNFQNTMGIYTAYVDGYDSDYNEQQLTDGIVSFSDGLDFVHHNNYPDPVFTTDGPPVIEPPPSDNVTPEPVTMTLIGTGLAGIAGVRRRRKSAV